MIYTASSSRTFSPDPHHQALREIYIASGDEAALRMMDEFDELEAKRRGSVVRFAKWAPLAAAVFVVCFSLWHTNEPLTNWVHNARVALAVGLPWAAKFTADLLLA